MAAIHLQIRLEKSSLAWSGKWEKFSRPGGEGRRRAQPRVGALRDGEVPSCSGCLHRASYTLGLQLVKDIQRGRGWNLILFGRVEREALRADSGALGER